MKGISVASLGADAQRQVREQLSAQQAPAKPAKYRNVKTRYRSVQGFERTFDSALEARVAQRYDLGIQTGLVLRWLPQMPILLPGGVRLVVDFLVFWTDGRVTWADAKGRETQASVNKRKQALALYGIEIEIVRS